MRMQSTPKWACFFYGSIIVSITLFRTQIILAKEQSPSAPSSCGLYLAESTIPNAGWGLFAGKDYQKDDIVTDGDVVIPIIELDWNNNNNIDLFWLWSEYVWGSITFPYMPEESESANMVQGASPGIGAAVNCLIGLDNVIEGSRVAFDNAHLNRRRHDDAGIGAFTPYYNRTGIAYTSIKTGQELFVHYGELYFTTRKEAYGMIPLEESYEKADALMEQYFMKLVPNVPPSLHSDLWDLIANSSLRNDSRVLNALPTNYSSMTNQTNNPHSTKELQAVQTVRSLQWLQTHGKCVDNIKPGTSTIPQAGRGAFARRFIPKDEIISTTPLIHIPNRSVLYQYEAILERNMNDEDDDFLVSPNMKKGPIHQQLLLNYCFGHHESTLLLSPYGVLTSLINHGSKQAANARIVWSDDAFLLHPEWRNQTVSSLNHYKHAGLSFDYVALRDIREDEEILIDYGDAWQSAWDEHVARWKPPRDAERYQPAYELNGDVDSILPTIRYPADNVMLYVNELYCDMAGVVFDEEEHEDEEWIASVVLDRYETAHRGENTIYMAQTFSIDNDEHQQQTYIEYTSILFQAPRDAFLFKDMPYTREHAMTWSFRHEMMIPDDIFPEAWRTKQNGGQE